ncbi:MAG: hypothetical protein KJ964_10590 [Verrucomicrobia bacterium]|nr:hypothetical protein [Verrucomicrobiota bacterium]
MTQQVNAIAIGVPVKAVCWVKEFAGTDPEGKPCLYATMGQSGSRFFVLRIDIGTGKCAKFSAGQEGGAFPPVAIWSRSGNCLYIGSYSGHLHRFIPGLEKVETIGAINPGAANFACGIAEHPDGTLFIGSHPGCDLTRYNPETGNFTRYGRMDPDEMYFYPMAGADGTVAGMAKVMRPHVVVLDPETGEHRAVGPVADKNSQQGQVELVKASDGLLYIKSHEGNFRVSGMDIFPVKDLPEPMPAPVLPDGSTWRWLDADIFEYRKLAIISPNGSERILNLDWEGDGTEIFMCHTGPDGKIYGSSVLPEHFFSFDPASGRLKDHGACSTAGGEAYSMANLDGRIYIGSYPGAKFSVYDPSRPYRFGTDRDANPREFGRIDDVSYRPFSMVAGPAGKVWIASVPDYGMWEGTLAWFDPQTEKFHSHRHLLPDCSPTALTYLEEENLLLAGLAMIGGSGTVPRAKNGGFILWDPDRDAAVWKGDFGLSIYSVVDICATGRGLAHALIRTVEADQETHSLALLDMRKRSVVSQTTLTRPPHGYVNPGLVMHNRHVYGFTHRGIFRAPLGTTDVEVYWELPADGDVPELSTYSATVIDNTLYFGCGHKLLSVSLP